MPKKLRPTAIPVFFDFAEISAQTTLFNSYLSADVAKTKAYRDALKDLVAKSAMGKKPIPTRQPDSLYSPTSLIFRS